MMMMMIIIISIIIIIIIIQIGELLMTYLQDWLTHCFVTGCVIL